MQILKIPIDYWIFCYSFLVIRFNFDLFYVLSSHNLFQLFQLLHFIYCRLANFVASSYIYVQIVWWINFESLNEGCAYWHMLWDSTFFVHSLMVQIWFHSQACFKSVCLSRHLEDKREACCGVMISWQIRRLLSLLLTRQTFTFMSFSAWPIDNCSFCYSLHYLLPLPLTEKFNSFYSSQHLIKSHWDIVNE